MGIINTGENKSHDSMADLILEAQSQGKEISLKIRQNSKVHEVLAHKGEEAPLALDKLFKEAKIDLLSIRAIRIKAQKQSSLLSFFLVKTIKHALVIGKHLKPLYR